MVVSHTWPLKNEVTCSISAWLPPEMGFYTCILCSELVSPGSSRGCWSMVAVVPDLYKQQQGEGRRENLLRASANGEQLIQANAVWERLQYMGVGMW